MQMKLFFVKYIFNLTNEKSNKKTYLIDLTLGPEKLEIRYCNYNLRNFWLQVQMDYSVFNNDFSRKNMNYASRAHSIM